MKRKKEPRHGWATVCGEGTKKTRTKYSHHSTRGQARNNHRCGPAWIDPPVVTGGELWQESFLIGQVALDYLESDVEGNA